jgi:hypothetical protein
MKSKWNSQQGFGKFWPFTRFRVVLSVKERGGQTRGVGDKGGGKGID